MKSAKFQAEICFYEHDDEDLDYYVYSNCFFGAKVKTARNKAMDGLDEILDERPCPAVVNVIDLTKMKVVEHIEIRR